DPAVMGVGADDDRRGDGSDAWLGLKAGSEGLCKQVKLAVVLLQEIALLDDGTGQTTSLAPSDCRRVVLCGGAADPPCRDRADLRVGQGLARIYPQVDAAQQREEGVAVRGALLIEDRSRGEQH